MLINKRLFNLFFGVVTLLGLDHMALASAACQAARHGVNRHINHVIQLFLTQRITTPAIHH